MLPSTHNCDPFARTKGLTVKTLTENRRFFMVSTLSTAAFLTPKDIWCQIVACLPIYFIIEFTISVSSIVRVREGISPIWTGTE